MHKSAHGIDFSCYGSALKLNKLPFPLEIFTIQGLCKYVLFKNLQFASVHTARHFNAVIWDLFIKLLQSFKHSRAQQIYVLNILLNQWLY